MTQVKDIRKMYFEEGKNISEIARDTGHDRKTVRGYLDKDNWNEELPKVKKEATFPKLDPYKQDIDTWLTEDKNGLTVYGIIKIHRMALKSAEQKI